LAYKIIFAPNVYYEKSLSLIDIGFSTQVKNKNKLQIINHEMWSVKSINVLEELGWN